MKRMLRRGFKEYELLDRDHPESPGSSLIFNHETSAQNFLQGFITDPFSMMALRDLLDEDPLHTDPTRLEDQDIIQQVARQMVRGQVRVVVIAVRPTEGLAVPYDPTKTPVEEEEEEEGPVEEVAPATANWIKFQVVDEDTGEPVKDVTLKIKLPSDEVKEYKTDGSGTIEIQDLTPGSCEILEMRDEDALEVTRLQ